MPAADYVLQGAGTTAHHCTAADAPAQLQRSAMPPRSMYRLRSVHNQVVSRAAHCHASSAAAAAAAVVPTRLNSRSGMEYRRMGRSALATIGANCNLTLHT